MTKEYLTFVDIGNPADLPNDEERELFIKDLTPEEHKYKYAGRYVRARVSRQPLPRADTLWIRFRFGVLHPKPYSIKIIEELGDVPPVPR